MITQTKPRDRLTTWIGFMHVDRLKSKGLYFAHDIGNFFIALLPSMSSAGACWPSLAISNIRAS